MLSDVRIRGLKPQAKPFKATDGEGMHLFVTPAGGKLWRLAYRFDGKQKLLSLGAYPEVSLADARDRRLAARKLLANGVDPSAAKKADRAATEAERANHFEAVAREWCDKAGATLSEKYRAQVLARLEADVFPAIGSKPLTAITAPDMLDALRKVEARGAIETTRRLSQYIARVFRFAVASGRATINPAADLKGALERRPRVKHHATIKAKELPDLMSSLDAYEGDKRTLLALRLTLYTATRRSEVRFADWTEFEGLDGKEPLWRIPAGRMKMHREHLVPLAPQVVAVLGELRKISGGRGHLFPARGKSKAGVISENTMLYALYRMGYHSRLTVHGFRGITSTALNERGYNRDWIEIQLAHTEDDEVRSAYNSAEYLPQRREMMQWWADFVDSAAKDGAVLGLAK